MNKLWSVTIAFTLAVAGSVGAKDGMTPKRIVAEYLRLLENDPAKAKTLLAPDAVVVTMDFGGPMAEAFRGFSNRLRQARCSPPRMRSKGRRHFGTVVSADIVKAEWTCSAPTENIPPSYALHFFVQKKRILGAAFQDPSGYKLTTPPP